jgi:GntR family transcriptional regulator / MocR family aminotransferase
MRASFRLTGADGRSRIGTVNESSQPIDVLLAVRKDGTRTLGRQIEEQLRSAIQDGALPAGARVPSTRDLAAQLAVSRRVVVDAYAQLAAEGYLSLRQGARPRVSPAVVQHRQDAESTPAPVRAPRYDFRPSVPDVSAFPRAAWTRSLRQAVSTITDADLGYGDPRGLVDLRVALSAYLGRVRGAVAAPDRVIVTAGYTQGLGVVCRALAAGGARRVAVEDPCNPEQRDVVRRAGLDVVPVSVDERGVRVDALAGTDAAGVVLTPAHQHPTGVLLAPDRRAALLRWLRDADAIAIEDDYDAEFRYDRAAVGALQGLDPDRVAYAGSASKTLAPALRLGWLVVPGALLEATIQEKLMADMGSPRIEQLAFADFVGRGELDRHLRRMRVVYRARRDRLVESIAAELPDARITGIAAGLHVAVELAGDVDEAAVLAACEQRRVAVDSRRAYHCLPTSAPTTLMVGYGQIAEAAIPNGVAELARAIRAAT